MTSGFDSRAYEEDQGRRRVAASDALRAMPEYLELVDDYGRGPVITLLCPRGHRLLPVITESGQQRAVIISPLPDHMARRSGRVTAHAEPWRHGKRVCLHPGCPVLIPHDGYCDQHGGDMESIGGVRTRFTCRQPKCPWAQNVTTARLLQLYGLAVKLGRKDIPLGDTPH